MKASFSPRTIAELRANDPHQSAEEWAAAVSREGSWCTPWMDWLARSSAGERVKPPTMGAPEKGYPTLEDAPGSYVLVSLRAASSCVRAAHQLQGRFDASPGFRFLVLTPLFTGTGLLSGLGNRPVTMRLQQFPRIVLDLNFSHPHRVPSGRWLELKVA